MNIDYKCPECGNLYRSTDFRFKAPKCPKCKTWLDYVDSEPEDENPVETHETNKVVEKQAQANVKMYDLVAAQDRTTSAVRSLAVFFFYNLIWGSGVGFLVLLASLIPADKECTLIGCNTTANPLAGFILFVAFAVGVVGIFITMSRAIKELRASRNSDSFM